jgi:Flp pilus assembly protein TadD
VIDRGSRGRSRGTLARRAACAVILGAAWLGHASPSHASSPSTGATPARPPIRATPRSTLPARAALPAGKKPAELAHNARLLEELGAYGRAAATLRQLRAVTPRDADLELALALDEARSGDADSARARLWGRTLSAALVDSLPLSRRHDYAWDREALWLDGRFDGWNWYVARARAEVALGMGRFADAHAAAALAAQARPLAGKEWLLLAVCAGLDGARDEARLAAERAAALDPTLPEARYLCGLYAWHSGQRLEAHTHFRAAVAMDSSWSVPALALVRSSLPGAAPDTLPHEFLTGVRRVGELTSWDRPKLEEFEQMDQPAVLLKRGQPQVPDSLHALLQPVELNLPVLVDERGRAVLHELPWFAPSRLPEPIVSALLASLPDWRFRPAIRLGEMRRVWAVVQYSYKP